MKKLILFTLLLAGCAHSPSKSICQNIDGGPTVCDMGKFLWISHGTLADKRLFAPDPQPSPTPKNLERKDK